MYDGKVIHSARDEFGSIDIVDESTARTMHFGSRARQTTMFLRDPVALALSYTRYMLSGLLLSSVPRSVLMLGLGGGALARFVRHHWPGCRISAVEKRALVVALAREYFALPDEHFAVHVMAAEEFLAGKRPAEYDWILVDIHDRNGMSPALREPEFFVRCRALLSARGILAANLWTGDREAMLKGINRSLHEVFDGRVLHLPVARKRNTVALGCNFALPALEVRLARRKALELEDRYGVEFSQFLWELMQHNPGLLH
jgi:spermidine synthase